MGVITFYFHWEFIIKPIYAKVCIVNRGITTTAEVLYFIDTLVKVQNRPLIHLVLQFDMNGSTRKTNKLKILIKKQDLVKYKIGANILIKYDPKNLKNIEVLSITDVSRPF